MLRFRIHGIKDGKYQLDLESDVREIKELSEEFIDSVSIKGILTKIGKRYTFVGKAKCNAKLICDISLEEFIEEIETDIEISFVANNELYFLNKAKSNFESETGDIIIHEDEQEIDFSEQVRQELMISLPMKRVAPSFRDKSIEDIYPQFMADKQEKPEIDERWKGLENLKLEN